MSGEPSVGDWQIERFLLGELPGDEDSAVRAAAAADSSLRERLDALARSNAEILARHPARAFGAAVRARIVATPPSQSDGRIGRRTVATALTLSAAVLAVAVLVQRAPHRERGDTRIKGLSPRLLLFRQRAAAPAEPLSPGSTARRDDVVQIAYQAAGRRFGVVLSIDGRGTVTRHLPKEGALAASLEPGSPMPLPDAYRLDDAPSFERFYLVLADEPFPVETIVAALRRWSGARPPNDAADGRLDLPATFDQHTLVLRKESR